MLGQTETVFGSQVRFVDAPEDVASQGLLGQQADRNIRHVGSENAYDPNQSHYTKLVNDKNPEYSQDKSVSYPTGYTKYIANPNVPVNITKKSDNSTSYDFPPGAAGERA